MAGTNGSGPLVEGADGPVGKHVTDAFKLLSDENRLAILLALWDAYDPHADSNIVSFTDLYDRVNVEDSGNFSYHLDKLVGHFVDEAPGGYELRGAGHKIVQAVIAGSGLEDRSLPPTEIPRSCHRCGAPVEISYEDQRLYQLCTGCEGNIGPGPIEDGPPRCPSKEPEGTLMAWDLEPAGLAHRSPEEVFVAGTIQFHRAVGLLIRGICPECSGRVEEHLHVCESHDAGPESLCSVCGTRDQVRVSYICSVCKHAGSFPVQAAVYDHPAVVSFYHDHGFEMTYGLEDPVECARLWDRLQKDHELISEDPLLVRVSVPYDGATLYLTLDGDLEVVEVRRGEREQAEAPLKT